MVAMSGAQPRIQWDLLFNFSPSPTPLFHGGQLPFATARFQPGQQSPTATTSRIRPILSLCVTLQGAKHRCFPFPSILVIQTQLSIPQTLSHHPEKQPLSYLTGLEAAEGPGGRGWTSTLSPPAAGEHPTVPPRPFQLLGLAQGQAGLEIKF